MYSVDTSFFMDWQARYYPLDVFPGFSAKIEALISSGECVAVQLVLEELNAVAPPGLKTWAGAQASLFLPLEPEVHSRRRQSKHATPI